MVKNSSIAAGFAVSELSSLLPRLVNADAGELTAVLLGVVSAYMLITLPLAYGVNRIERRVAILR
jgi:glutamate transport system permease protein